MDDVLLGSYFGGLGDNLQFSTLPEEFSKQKGRDTYIVDETTFRNKEIYDLVWGCNPYVKGVKEGRRTAGDIPEIDFVNPNGYYSSITNWEYLHGLEPNNMYPKIYYIPKKLVGYENTILVDLSSISLKHNGDKSSFPPAYDEKEVRDTYNTIRMMYKDCRFGAVQFQQDLGTNSFTVLSDADITVKSIFHYCDLMASSYGIVGLYSGQSALSSAIMEYNPNLLSLCLISEAVHKKHCKQSGFIFDNLNYNIIPETGEVRETTIH